MNTYHGWGVQRELADGGYELLRSYAINLPFDGPKGSKSPFFRTRQEARSWLKHKRMGRNSYYGDYGDCHVVRVRVVVEEEG